jgi:hypothetical protein
MKYIVQLEKTKTETQYLYWGNGDPAKMAIIEYAERFSSRGDAYIALGKIMNANPELKFPNAKIIEVEE